MVEGPGERRSWPLLSRHCAKAAFLVSESLDRKLSWMERRKLDLHMALCRLSRRHRQDLAWMRRMLELDVERYDSDDSTARLSEEARQRIKSALKDVLRNQRKSPGSDGT